MKVKEIDIDTFNAFATKHVLKNFYQSKQYGNLMKKSEYSVMYIGGYKDETLVAASLILYKNIAPSIKYGYAPRGFLIDYYDTDLLKEFSKKVKDFFFTKGYAFIKINPEVTYAIVDLEKQTKVISSKSEALIKTLKESGYDKLKDNLYFESLLPKFTPVINLTTFDLNNLSNEVKDQINGIDEKGAYFTTGKKEDIELFYSFIEDKATKNKSYYEAMMDNFKPDDMIDLLLLNLDYSNFVTYLQRRYAQEQSNNDAINNLFRDDPQNDELYNKKMQSDKLLSDISSDIALANQKMQENILKDVYGGALIIKHEGRITIFITGQKNEFKLIDFKTFMYYKIIKEYQNAGYLFMDLNGITGDFTDKNPYKELNQFKLKFKPTVYEYIGEFDLIVNKPIHQILWSTNKIQKEFYK